MQVFQSLENLGGYMNYGLLCELLFSVLDDTVTEERMVGVDACPACML